MDEQNKNQENLGTGITSPTPGITQSTADTGTEKTLKDLQAELVAMDFEGAEEIKSKSVALNIIAAIKKKEAEVIANAEENTPDDPAAVRDDSKKDEKKYFGKAEAMRLHLAKQPRVHMVIPLGIGERMGTVETWQANGYRLNILKGVSVMLPQQVAESLAESYQLTSSAGKDFLIDRNEDVKKNLE